jgi:hypothetical protein
MRRTTLTAIVVVFGLAFDCGKGHGTDLSTPQAAVKSYVSAMKAGDAAGMKASITGGDPQLVDAIVNAQVSRKKLEDAAVAKFGEEGRSMASGGDSQANYDKLADADVKQDGDSATVTPKDHSLPGGGIVLKKVNGDWKIDMSATPGMDQMAAMLPMISKMSGMNDELAGEISAGKYKSVVDAKAAQSQKLMSAVTGGAGISMPKPPDAK